MNRKLLTAAMIALLPLVFGLTGCSRTASQASRQASPPDASQDAPMPGSKTLTLFLPCGMVIPLRAVTDAFENQHPDVEIRTVLDNAVVLARRIFEKKEHADLFISPGERQIGMLEQRGLVDTASKRAFARMTLVVAVPADNPADIHSPEDLLAADTVSCPDPDLNSAGYYAKQALTQLGLWQKLEPAMLFTDHAITSHQFVAEGKSQAGFMYKRCPLETSAKIAPDTVTLAFELPADSYGPANAVIAPLKDAKHPAFAKDFVQFITSEQGLSLLEQNGLQPAPQTASTPPETRRSPSDRHGRGALAHRNTDRRGLPAVRPRG